MFSSTGTAVAQVPVLLSPVAQYYCTGGRILDLSYRTGRPILPVDPSTTVFYSRKGRELSLDSIDLPYMQYELE